jgi:hypothetical protein
MDIGGWRASLGLESMRRRFALRPMDPEDLRAIISAYQKCVAEMVSRFGGFVAKYLGDEDR